MGNNKSVKKNMMSFQEFMVEFKLSFQDEYADLCEIYEYHEEMIRKNGHDLHGIILRKKDNKIAPVFYYEEFYKSYRNGVSISESIRKMADFLYFQELPDEDMAKSLADWNCTKKKLIVKLINYENNRSFLRTVPFKRIGDMAVVSQVHLESEVYGNGAITVDEDLMDLWGISREELFDTALDNMLDYPVKMINLYEETSIDKEKYAEAPRIYVSIFEKPINGAASILRTDELKVFANKVGYDLFVMPVSIHEALLVEYRDDLREEFLAEMLYSINHDHESIDDVLSQNIYLLKRDHEYLIDITNNKDVCIVG